MTADKTFIFVVVLLVLIMGVLFLLLRNASAKGFRFRRADWDGSCLSVQVDMPPIINCDGQPNTAWLDNITLRYTTNSSTGRDVLVAKLFLRQDWTKTEEELKQDLLIQRATSGQPEVLRISVERNSLHSKGSPIVHLSFVKDEPEPADNALPPDKL